MTNEKFYLSKRAFEAPPIESYEMPIGEMFPMPKGWSLNPRHDYPFEIQYRWIRVGDRILSREGSFTGPVITIHTTINTANNSIDILVLSSIEINKLEEIGYIKTIDSVKLFHYHKYIYKHDLQDLVDAYYNEMKLLEDANLHKIYLNAYKNWKKETTASFNISKRAVQLDITPAKRTAVSLFKIIQFLFHRVPPGQKLKFYNRLKGKITRLAPGVIGIKKMPPSAAIGQSINMAKNLLSGLNPLFVRQVLLELTYLLSNIGLEQLR